MRNAIDICLQINCICLSVCLSVCLYVCLSISFCMSVCVSHFPSGETTIDSVFPVCLYILFHLFRPFVHIVWYLESTAIKAAPVLSFYFLLISKGQVSPGCTCTWTQSLTSAGTHYRRAQHVCDTSHIRDTEITPNTNLKCAPLQYDSVTADRSLYVRILGLPYIIYCGSLHYKALSKSQISSNIEYRNRIFS